jgi:hypothetical protein
MYKHVVIIEEPPGGVGGRFNLAKIFNQHSNIWAGNKSGVRNRFGIGSAVVLILFIGFNYLREHSYIL